MKKRMSIYNPFTEKVKVDITDEALIENALSGDKKSLEDLVKRHQSWIYNIALKMVWDADEAADITQEVLVKVITKLNTFKGNSKFSTWLYRIVKNHVLNTQKGRAEASTTSFAQFGKGLETMEDAEVPDNYDDVFKKILVEEAKISCMMGMLLCLDREQRLIFILGELFEVTDKVGGEILEISQGNFRVKLSRAKKQLYNFMNFQCGLINKKNPCRCARKTAGFIKAGYVDPERLQFQKDHYHKIRRAALPKSKKYEAKVMTAYQKLFQAHPFLNAPDTIASLKKLLDSQEIKNTFNLY